MEITCPRCQSLHEIEPPASVRARGPRSLKFRCSHCGHTFTVDPTPMMSLEPAAPPPLAAGNAEPIQKVRSDGQEWSLPDGFALVRAILEGKVGRDAEVSNHGMRWTRAGDRADLQLFFEAAEALSHKHHNLRTELPPEHDEEIIVDVGDGEDAPPIHAAPAVSVAVPGAPLDRLDLDTVVMDFAGREDTQEQTVGAAGLDEAPIPDVPAGFDSLEDESRRAVHRPVPGLPVAADPPPTHPVVPVARSWPTPAGVALPGEPSPLPSEPSFYGSQEPTSPYPLDPPPPIPRPPPTLVPTIPRSPAEVELSPMSAPSARNADVFEDEPEPTKSGVSGLLLAATFALLAVGVGAGWWFFSHRPVPEAEKVAEVLPAPEAAAPEAPAAAPEAAPDAAKAAATPEAAPATPEPATRPPEPPAPKPVAETRPRTEPKPPAEPRPAAEPKPAGGKKLVNEAWKAIEAEDYQKAHGLFDRAFEASGSANALYGRGYANEKLGDKVSAADDYCHALAVGGLDVDMTREVEGGLRRVGRTCN